MKTIKWGSVLAMALFIIGVATRDGESHIAKNAKIQPVEQVLKVNAEELWQAYENNTQRANYQYQGKKLLLEGTIAFTRYGVNSEPYVTLAAGLEYEMHRPEVRFKQAEFDKAANLKVGQHIQLRCIGNGEVLGAPMLRQCVIV